jgi:hypothetical protein
VSIGGIAYAVYFGVAADGPRGGAIAVAISFAALFAARGTPQKVIEMTDPATGGNVGEEGTPETKIELLVTALSTMIDSQRLEKKYLTWTTVMGTLVWGFGDQIARWFGAPI